MSTDNLNLIKLGLLVLTDVEQRPIKSVEVSPCRILTHDMESDQVERCDPDQAEFYGMYLIHDDGRAEYLADFTTEREANTFRDWLIGFASHYMTKQRDALIKIKALLIDSHLISKDDLHQRIGNCKYYINDALKG